MPLMVNHAACFVCTFSFFFFVVPERMMAPGAAGPDWLRPVVGGKLGLGGERQSRGKNRLAQKGTRRETFNVWERQTAELLGHVETNMEAAIGKCRHVCRS
jgi:hypothetical protein